jgi:DNA replication protein
MKPSERYAGHADFLGSSFVSIPYEWLVRVKDLGLTPTEFLVLVQILGASQVKRMDFLTPQELGELCSLTPHEVSDVVGALVSRGMLSIGERVDDNGTHANYFDLKPLWDRLRGKDPMKSRVREWRRDPVSLFEEEFGRPLSGLECEQIRQWLEVDGMPEWLVIEALREAVLANKYSFKYIDRILFDWQRHRIRTRQELDNYRQSYRERQRAREEAAVSQPAKQKNSKRQSLTSSGRDERYAAFYELFPDA